MRVRTDDKGTVELVADDPREADLLERYENQQNAGRARSSRVTRLVRLKNGSVGVVLETGHPNIVVLPGERVPLKGQKVRYSLARIIRIG